MNEKKIKYGYSVLQYQHNPWLKERLNVGVLVFSQNARYLRLKTRSWDGRILSAYPSIEKSSFSEDLRQIERNVVRFARGEFVSPSLSLVSTHPSTLNYTEWDAQLIGRMLAPDADSSYRWESGGVGICQSLDDQLEDLFRRFVVGYEKVKPDSTRSDTQVWSTFSSKLSARNLDHFLETGKVVRTELGNVTFHAAYQNGALHVIQPLSFDLATDDNVTAKAAKWAGYAHSVRVGGDRVTPHFIIGRPGRESLESSFALAKRFLEKVAGQGNVVVEEEVERLVDAVEADLARH